MSAQLITCYFWALRSIDLVFMGQLRSGSLEVDDEFVGERLLVVVIMLGEIVLTQIPRLIRCSALWTY